MPSMDINADLGESFGNWVLGEDEALMPLITTANIACGYHGGDPLVMERTAALAREHVAARSHPGYPDLLGFGRRRYTLSPEEAAAYIRYQTGALIKQFHEVVADTGGTVIGFEVENEGAISPGDVVARIEPAG